MRTIKQPWLTSDRQQQSTCHAQAMRKPSHMHTCFVMQSVAWRTQRRRAPLNLMLTATLVTLQRDVNSTKNSNLLSDIPQKPCGCFAVCKWVVAARLRCNWKQRNISAALSIYRRSTISKYSLQHTGSLSASQSSIAWLTMFGGGRDSVTCRGERCVTNATEVTGSPTGPTERYMLRCGWITDWHATL